MVQLFLFSAGGLKCGIPLAGIQSVIQMMDFTPSTSSGEGPAGTVNLHRRIIPVYSMGVLLGAPDRSPRLSDMLLITCAGTETVALWIDNTRGVEEPDLSQTPALGQKGGSRIPQSIVVTSSNLLVISDLAEFLSRAHEPGLQDVIQALRRDEEALASPPLDEMESDSSQVHAILAERAAKMVQPDYRASPAELTEILRFHLAYQEYAIEMDYVREVILTGEITPVPGTPDFISGICAARGQIISLVDLRSLFRIPERGLTDLNRVIVMTDGKITFGILADSISGVGPIALDQVILPSDELPGGSKYLKGIMSGNVYVLDAAAILNDPGIIVDDA
jgi:purine-binding chemotaxis protein CheW